MPAISAVESSSPLLSDSESFDSVFKDEEDEAVKLYVGLTSISEVEGWWLDVVVKFSHDEEIVIERSGDTTAVLLDPGGPVLSVLRNEELRRTPVMDVTVRGCLLTDVLSLVVVCIILAMMEYDGVDKIFPTPLVFVVVFGTTLSVD